MISARALVKLAAGLCIALSAANSYAKVQATDSAGRSVVLDEPAQRIVALAPHIVENVFSAGAGDKLVGVVSYSDYPPAAGDIPVVGSYHAFSLEKIASLRPDLVITWAEGDGEAVAEPFEELGIPVYVDEPRELKEVARSVRNIGALSGTREQARRRADHFMRTLARLREEYSHRQPVSVFYQVWNEPLQTVNESHIISAVIELCGGDNVFKDTPVIAPKVSLEAVIARNPQAIVASGMGQERPEWLNEWRQYPQMTAVARENLFFVPPDILQRHTVRILQGAEQMCHSLQRARENLAQTGTAKEGP